MEHVDISDHFQMSKRGKKVSRYLGDRHAKLLIDRIEHRLDEMGLNAKTASVKAGHGATFVSDIINGKNQNPTLVVIQSLARILECDVGYLTGEQPEPRHGGTDLVAEIPVIGMAEAGSFRVMADVDHEIINNIKTISAKRSLRFPKRQHFALEVRGDSMNAARPNPILDGAIVLCVDMGAELEIESGNIYAVRRTLDDGQTWECTVKRAQVYRSRYELRPESNNPKYEPLIIPRDAGREADDGKQVEAIGLVYGVFYDLEEQ